MRRHGWYGLTVWLAVTAMLAFVLVAACTARGQCPGGVCPANPGMYRQPQFHLPQPNRPTPAWRYERATGHRGAVVRVVCYDQDGKQSIGSGVLVQYRRRPLILTAWHVIKTARRIRVWLSTGRWYEARALATDGTWDCAVLDIGQPEGIEPAELEYGDEAHPGQNDRLESAGYGGDGKLAVNTGYFLGYSRPTSTAGPTDWLRLSGYARSGDSGGPIFSARGRVVGVLWGTDGSEVVGTQAGRLHQVLTAAMEKLPVQQQAMTEAAEEKCLPWRRPLVTLPQPVPQPAPAPSVVVQGDPRVGVSLQSIDAKLGVIVANSRPAEVPKPEPEAAPQGLSPLLAGLAILGSAVLGCVVYFAAQKG